MSYKYNVFEKGCGPKEDNIVKKNTLEKILSVPITSYLHCTARIL